MKKKRNFYHFAQKLFFTGRKKPKIRQSARKFFQNYKQNKQFYLQIRRANQLENPSNIVGRAVGAGAEKQKPI